ncbi:MAG: hypothetical protein ACOYNC_12240 [Bacteroidales bacterium]
MKTTMKIFAAITIMFACTLAASAQKTDNANISGKAEVLQGIDVTGKIDLDFGRVSPGLAKTIDLNNVATGGQVGEGTQTTGVFTVSASAGSNVQIQFTTLPAGLKNANNDNLPIGAYTAGYGTDIPFAGDTFDPGTGTQVTSGNFPTNVIDSKNAIYVYIGGTVTPGPSQAIGNYTSNITLTATYN